MSSIKTSMRTKGFCVQIFGSDVVDKWLVLFERKSWILFKFNLGLDGRDGWSINEQPTR
jgi:hypothetical protein